MQQSSATKPAGAAAGDFSRFIRAVGRGQHLSRPLTEAEAAEAMAMILAGEVAPVQLGAFLVVLRYRRETAAELAGFVRAARARMAAPADLGAELDWPSYADRHRQLPYFLLAALALAEAGVRVAMHGIAGAGPVATPAVLGALGIAPAADYRAAARQLDSTGLTYLPIETFCPPLAELFALRPVLGLRSPANSFCRELNPLAAPGQLQGVFHPTYLPLHQEAARLLDQPAAAIFKGGGGEVQRNPLKPCRTARVIDAMVDEETWPALLPGESHAWREDPLDPAEVVGLWRGTRQAPPAEAAVTGTMAIALKLLGRADSQQAAEAAAEALWRDRPKRKYGAQTTTGT